MIGGYSVSVTFLSPKPYPYLSAAAPYCAWFATLGSSVFTFDHEEGAADDAGQF
jgi:hypothetical protein